MPSQAAESTLAETQTTTVDVKLTGHVRTAVGEPGMAFTFEDDTLREFLDACFEAYDVHDLVIAETKDDATAPGWAPAPEELPGTWKKNPEGEQTRAHARVLVTGGSTSTTRVSTRHSRMATASHSSIRSCSAGKGRFPHHVWRPSSL